MVEVAILHKRLAHYRIPLYQKIQEYFPDISLSVYCGKNHGEKGQSGINVPFQDLNYVHERNNYTIGSLAFQPATVRDVLLKRYDLIICEGSLSILSNIFILLFRRFLFLKNVLWLKGWPRDDLDSTALKWFRKIFLHLGDNYIVYGERGKQNLISYGIESKKIYVAQNTVDTDRILESNHTEGLSCDDSSVREIIDLNPKFIFYIGRLVSKKGVSDLLNAFALFQRESNDNDTALIIAGTGPETLPLQNLKNELKLERCFFVGGISDNDAEILFMGSTCCVFPGAVGLAMNQAMASQKAVVCADESGPDTELLINDVNGLRYEHGNIDQLSDCLKKILMNENLRTALGIKARQTIKDKATIDNMAICYANAIYSALNNDHSSRESK
jgi:glycosyltransferase involved in cell wall biosynthesis